MDEEYVVSGLEAIVDGMLKRMERVSPGVVKAEPGTYMLTVGRDIDEDESDPLRVGIFPVVAWRVHENSDGEEEWEPLCLAAEFPFPQPWHCIGGKALEVFPPITLDMALKWIEDNQALFTKKELGGDSFVWNIRDQYMWHFLERVIPLPKENPDD